MTSPIFFPAFVRKYVVQAKSKGGTWKDHNRHQRLEEAEREARRLVRRKPNLPVRIINHLTEQVVKNYPGQSQK